VRVQQTMTDAFSKRTNVLRQFGSLRILLRHAAPSPLALESLQRVFAETPDEDGMVRGLLLRRARLIEMQSDGINPGGVPSVLAFLFHPFLVHNLRVQIEEFPEVMAAARLPWPDKIGALSAIGEAAANRDGRSSFRRQVFGPPFNLAVLSPEASPMFAGTWLAVRRLAVTTLAIERYRRAHDGDPPRNLAPLVPAYLPALPVDPFTGKSLVYTPSASDYLLYSVDVNRTDDGGQIYGLGSLNPLPYPRLRDLGIRVPRTPQRGAL
jgi:hypothetical protein